MEAEFPRKLKFLFEPHPNKVTWGGRDGIKSWSYATALVEMSSSLGYWKNLPDQTGKGRTCLRVMCARETMKSIKDSVHKLLGDTIVRLNLQDRFTVTDHRITCRNGGEFFFAGLRHNPEAIKSAEGVDIVDVEEANDVSADSWDKLIPTIRKPGAEIWLRFNPELATDDTYKRWVLNPPPGTVVVKTGWEDNRWLSERSRVAIEHMRETNPSKYLHVYGGECRSSVTGAIFGKEMKDALAEGRIGTVPYNRARPVHTIWDLGFGDTNSIWFVQVYDGFYNFIDYEQGAGKIIADYVIILQDRKYVYGTDWLPHDGIDTIIHKRLNGTQDRSRSIEQLLRDAGRSPRIVPKIYVTDQINAARTLFPQCRFDAEKCADGLQALRHYQWDPDIDKQECPHCGGGGIKNGKECPTCQASGEVFKVAPKVPLHNWASHASSAFMGASIALKQPKLELPASRPQRAEAII